MEGFLTDPLNYARPFEAARGVIERRRKEREGGGREKKREPYKNIIERIYAILVLPSAASHTTSDIPGDPPGFSLVPGES